jgi:hypothetical protein
MQELTTEVLIVGGGVGGTTAAIQAARRGAKTILVSEWSWLGGMLTTAGVSAPDGNELIPWQTGIWGEFLQALHSQEKAGLNHGWVSFFTFQPATAANILAEWVNSLPNLHWIPGEIPVAILKQGNSITGVQFSDLIVKAQIIIDGTELGDLLELGEIPYRWGWELQSVWGEPSAPIVESELTKNYPVQAPTWVVIMQDFIKDTAPPIAQPANYQPGKFTDAWLNHGPQQFLNYGGLPGNQMMINWPIHGNDYGEGVERLIHSPQAKQEFLQECRQHTEAFAYHIQNTLGDRYGLATNSFPNGTAYALHPYYRESRRLEGLTTMTEQHILPIFGGNVAPLPMNEQGEVEAIALGNYANDHHYPSGNIPLQPKSVEWGGRWTGTPFTIPYRALIPVNINNFFVCEKNISVSHIANGATRLQPVVMNIGQAVGMAAALCIENNCQPRDLPVNLLQEALLSEPTAPASIIPLFNLTPDHPEWREIQLNYLKNPEDYPISGYFPDNKFISSINKVDQNLYKNCNQEFQGIFLADNPQSYRITVTFPRSHQGENWRLVTLHPDIDSYWREYLPGKEIKLWGQLNYAGPWLLVASIEK